MNYTFLVSCIFCWLAVADQDIPKSTVLSDVHGMVSCPASGHDTIPFLNNALSEICDNLLDDDGDGLQDAFDPDCPCEDKKFNTVCTPECEVLPDSFPKIEAKIKWVSEHSVLNKNGFEYISSLIITSENLYSSGYDALDNQFINYIQSINPKDGKNLNRILIDTFFFQLYGNILSYRNFVNSSDFMITRNNVLSH